MFIALLLVPMLNAEPVSLICSDIESKAKRVVMVDSDNKLITYTIDNQLQFNFSTNWQETETGIVANDDDEGLLEIEFNKYLGTLNLRFLNNTLKYEYQCNKAKSLLD